jgi:aminoglycoside/choline kinase family phosphotransferase
VGDASSRRYHRVSIEGGSPASVIVMELPADPLKSDEASGKAQPSELPFLNIQRYLESGGIAVPKIYGYDAEAGLMLLEDLGDATLESVVLGASREIQRAHYQLAIRDLVALQHRAATADPSCIAFGRSFNEELLHWELDHFREWLLEADRGAKLEPAERAIVEGAFKKVASALAGEPRIFVHRDYQSRNLMVQSGPRLRLIDFQDALLGTQAYDLVALLRDSYVELAPDLLDELLDYYAELAKVPNKAAFRRLFYLQTTQRKLKDAGRFVFIDRKKGNPKFLPSIPASLRYVRDALSRLPELESLQRVLGKYVPELN